MHVKPLSIYWIKFSAESNRNANFLNDPFVIKVKVNLQLFIQHHKRHGGVKKDRLIVPAPSAWAPTTLRALLLFHYALNTTDPQGKKIVSNTYNAGWNKGGKVNWYHPERNELIFVRIEYVSTSNCLENW